MAFYAAPNKLFILDAGLANGVVSIDLALAQFIQNGVHCVLNSLTVKIVKTLKSRSKTLRSLEDRSSAAKLLIKIQKKDTPCELPFFCF